MEKNFKKWHANKETIHHEKDRPFFHEREVWMCLLGVNVGFEQDGRGEEFLRPIVVVKKFNNEVCWGLPLTKNAKKSKHYYSIAPIAGRESSTAILSQIRLIDAKRLNYKIGDITEEEFKEIKKRLIGFLR